MNTPRADIAVWYEITASNRRWFRVLATATAIVYGGRIHKNDCEIYFFLLPSATDCVCLYSEMERANGEGKIGTGDGKLLQNRLSFAI